MTAHADVANPDVVILGGGLAGLTLARQLLLETDRSILILERRDSLPPDRQKVGESTVQLAGHYLAKVLDLEPYLLHQHFMKYNLRFYWPSGAGDGDRFEDYGHVAIRPFSNVPSYQVNRNTLEAELLRRNQESPRFELVTSVHGLEVELAVVDSGPHTIRFSSAGQQSSVQTPWVVDATGRGRYLARRLGLRREMPIEHGSVFWWVEGTVDIERLTDRSRQEVRLRPERRHIGHLPAFLATNHFMDEGLWFWVIPLQGKTSLGLVFDSSVVDYAEVATAEKATAWVCERFPLFARDLPRRKVLDASGFRRFSHDCERTMSADGWAMTGEAGRFTDPLYSPGSDLISIHNTLITAAIAAEDDGERASLCELYEQVMRAVTHAYVPSYGTSYDALGDQEVFALKYGWELSVYFVAYVFPFLNDLFSDRRFLLAFLRFFSRLGPINQGLHGLLSEFYQWKKQQDTPPPAQPLYFDLMSFPALRHAETCFYRIGVDVDEARQVLQEQLVHLEEMARFIVAHVVSVVAHDDRALRSDRFVDGIDLRTGNFQLEDQCRRWRDIGSDSTARQWQIDPAIMDCFRGPQATVVAAEDS
jgi:2-polyprenyl-6-methoxyphenol hydroxylase-like FAD-dependent oxidoreductase